MPTTVAPFLGRHSENKTSCEASRVGFVLSQRSVTRCDLHERCELTVEAEVMNKWPCLANKLLWVAPCWMTVRNNRQGR